MKNNILIVTGGTGGHVIPAVNFFNYIDTRSRNVYLLTDKRGYKYIKNITFSFLSICDFFWTKNIVHFLLFLDIVNSPNHYGNVFL